jgi:hypothetical protein
VTRAIDCSGGGAWLFVIGKVLLAATVSFLRQS